MALFTPRVSPSWDDVDNRIVMDISYEDERNKPCRSSTEEYEVTDLNTGKHYLCVNVACDIPTCHCDAAIIKEFT